MPGTFGKKPTDSHVVWTNRDGHGQGKKRFDFEYLELWAAHFDADYEERLRVDHERADEPREQHVVVFEWEETESETLTLGDREWTLGQSETPRTFVEIDDEGVARLKSHDHEAVVDIRELWLDGPVMKMRTVERGKTALDTRKLRSPKRRSEA